MTISAAKATLSKLIQRAHAGEEIMISRGDSLVARLVPIMERLPKRRAGTLRGKIKISPSFFDPLPDEELGG